MNSLEIFEVKAEAFLIMTGHMAPGKDPARVTYPKPLEERQEIWEKWFHQYGSCVAAMITAFDRFLGSRDSDV